jgi:hypothetical protein
MDVVAGRQQRVEVTGIERAEEEELQTPPPGR